MVEEARLDSPQANIIQSGRLRLRVLQCIRPLVGLWVEIQGPHHEPNTFLNRVA